MRLVAQRAEDPNTHDIGFIFDSSAIPGFHITGDGWYADIALRAADKLRARIVTRRRRKPVLDLDNEAHRGARKPRPTCGCGPWIRPPMVRQAGPSVIVRLQRVRHLTDRPDAQRRDGHGAGRSTALRSPTRGRR
jgi:hypothetical protein